MKTKYSKYKPSGVEWIGEIPGHWIKCELRYVLELLTDFESNGSFSSVKNNVKVDDEGLVWYVRMTDLENKNFRNENCKYCDLDTYNFLSKTKVFGGELLITKRGEIGKVYLFPYDCGLSVLGPNSYLIRLKTEKVSSNFLYYFYLSYEGQITLKLLDNSTTIGSLYKDDIKGSYVLIPPPIEQEQMVKYLDEKTGEIDNLISITEKKIELLKENRTSTINRVITKGLDPNVELKDSGIEWIGEIPEHWMVSKFKYVSEIVTGNTPSKTDGQKYYTEEDENGFLWVKPSNLLGYFYVNNSDEKLTEIGKKQTRVIPKDSIMICCIGNTIGKYGMSGEELSTNQQINSVIPTNKSTPWFCLYYVDVFTKDLLNRSNFVTLPILTKSDLENIEFILPPLPEQEEIVKYLDQITQDIDTLISIEQQRIETLKEYRQSLISEVITGKVRVCEEVKL